MPLPYEMMGKEVQLLPKVELLVSQSHVRHGRGHPPQPNQRNADSVHQ